VFYGRFSRQRETQNGGQHQKNEILSLPFLLKFAKTPPGEDASGNQNRSARIGRKDQTAPEETVYGRSCPVCGRSATIFGIMFGRHSLQPVQQGARVKPTCTVPLTRVGELIGKQLQHLDAEICP